MDGRPSGRDDGGHQACQPSRPEPAPDDILAPDTRPLPVVPRLASALDRRSAPRFALRLRPVVAGWERPLTRGMATRTILPPFFQIHCTPVDIEPITRSNPRTRPDTCSFDQEEPEPPPARSPAHVPPDPCPRRLGPEPNPRPHVPGRVVPRRAPARPRSPLRSRSRSPSTRSWPPTKAPGTRRSGCTRKVPTPSRPSPRAARSTRSCPGACGCSRSSRATSAA